MLSRRKWLVFLGLVAGLGAGGLYNSQCETIYKSSARVRIEPKEPVHFQYGMDRGGLHDNYADFDIRHDQLIGEHNIVSACLFGKRYDTLSSLSGIPDDEKVKYVQTNLEITQNREEPIIYEIEHYSKDPDDAKTILSGLIATYEEELKKQYEQSSSDVKGLLERMEKFFSDEVEEKRKRLFEVQQEYQALVVAPNGIDINQVRLPDLGAKIASEQAKLQEHNLDLERALKGIEGGTEEAEKIVWMLTTEDKVKENRYDSVSNANEIRSLKNELFKIDLEIKRKIDKFGIGHPEIKVLESTRESLLDRIDELEAEGEVTRGRPAIEILQYFAEQQQQAISELRRSIDAKEAEYNNLAKEINTNKMLKLKISELEEEITLAKESHEIASKQMIEVTSTESQNSRHKGFYFQTTKEPTYGEEVWPILPVILGIGGLLGSLFGFGLGCLVELADKTFHNPDQIIQQLRVPLIGHIPVIRQSKRYLVENSLIEPIVCSYHRPKSQVSEAFRAVRTALYFNTQGKEHSVIQVTSPTPGDGKSTLASNLAVSIAQSGKRVLLVDADMRRPRQHSTFGITSKVGFATVLSGQSDWRDTLFECEEIKGLTVMPCGAKPQNPAELSTSPQVKILIEEMRQEFDFVIIDTPPLLAVTDPCPIAARVDGVILCLRIKKNVRVSAERAVELLGGLGAHCIGLVVNGVGAQSGYGSQYTYGAYRAGYSYNGYGYGYGYGYGSGKYYEEDQRGRVANQPAAPRLEEQTTE